MKTLQILAGVMALVVVCGTLRAGQKVVYEGDSVVLRFEGGVLEAKAKTIVAFDDDGIPMLISAETPDKKVEGQYGLDDKGKPKNTGRLIFKDKFKFEVMSLKDIVTYHLEYLEITTVKDDKSGRYRGWILKAIASDNKAESVSQKKTITFDLPADRVLPIDKGRFKIGDAFISIQFPYKLGGVVRDDFPPNGQSPLEKD